MYIAAIQYLNYSSAEPKKQFAVYDSDTLVTLKQGHETWYELVDPNQGYKHTKLKELPKNVHKKKQTKKRQY